MAEPLLLRYLQPLLTGRRAECFELVRKGLDDATAKHLLCEVIWPAMTQVDRLFRDDRISQAVEQMATRINRTAADQLQAALPMTPRNGKRAVVLCAAMETEELGAQICADLLQAEGWEIFFVGRTVAHDEVVALLGQTQPHALLVFGSAPEDVPDMRGLIQYIRELGTCPTMNIVTSGGIFTRADDLWREIGADAFAPTARDLLRLLADLAPREPKSVRRSIVKKRNRKRKGAKLAVPALAGE